MKQSINKFNTFAAKELRENIRTKKLFALFCVFIFIALLSVLTARFMSEIFGGMLGAEGTMPFVIMMPDPVWTDSYAQLYSNLSEMGALIFIVLFMGIILKEKTSGTIDLMMAKGLSCTAFIMAKFAVAAAITLISLVITVLVTYVYTLALFDYAGNIGHVFLGALPFGVFILMMLSITIMWSAIAKSTAICATLSLVSFFLIILIDIIPWVGRYTPGNLLGHSMAISVTGVVGDNMGIQMGVAVIVTVLALCIAVHVLRRREG